MTTQTVNAKDMATVIALKLAPMLDRPTRFKPNFGKCLISFGSGNNSGMIKIKATMPGNFDVEAEVNLIEIALSGREAIDSILQSFAGAHSNAVQRRHSERNLIHAMHSALQKQRKG